MGVEEGYVNWAVILGKAPFFIGISWNPLGTLQDHMDIPGSSGFRKVTCITKCPLIERKQLYIPFNLAGKVSFTVAQNKQRNILIHRSV